MKKAPSQAQQATKSRDPAAEIAVMERLSQGAVAWMLGSSGSSVRDANPPRSADGSYNAQTVLKWRLQRPRKPLALTDPQYELVLQLVDQIAEYIGRVRDPIDRLVRELGEGDEVLGLILRAILDDFDSLNRFCPRVAPWEGQEIGSKYFVCQDCSKVRQGRRWRDMIVPRGGQSMKDFCPACSKKRGEANPGRNDWPLYGDDESDDVHATEFDDRGPQEE